MAFKIALVFLCHLATCLSANVPAETAVHAHLSAPTSPPAYNEAIDNGTFGYYPIRTYTTEDGLHSPETNFLQYDDQCDDGLYTFFTPRGWSLSDPGPMILDKYGELVWTQHTENGFGGQAYDFMVQQYRGESVLTFWLGDDRIRGHGSGWYYVLNSSYHLIKQVEAAGGLAADLHEFLITPEGTALMTMYQMMPHDVTEFREFDPENPDDHDPNWMWDCLFQEVDMETGALVFEWRASDHVQLNDTYHGIGPGGTKNDPFDWFHINSIHKDELGNYLISARYTHSITYIDGKTGDIIWTLGGKKNNFMDLSDGYGLNFAWQHDARFFGTDTFPNTYAPPVEKPGSTTKLLTLFDNAAEDQHYEYGLTYSRGLLLEITYPTPSSGYLAATDLHRRQEEAFPDEELSEELFREYSEPGRNLAKLRAINGTSPEYTVRVIKSYENPKHLRSSSQGSVQVLPAMHGERDPKILVGYGLNAVWTEFAADGTILCDVHYGAETSWERGDIQSYRTYKFPWVGRPQGRPSVDISDDDVEIYVSWNGATDVVDWILQCSDEDDGDEQSWADIIRVGKTGFETAIPIPEVVDTRFMRVIALGEAGRRLEHGTSEIIDRGVMATYFPALNQHLPEGLAHMSPLRVLLVLASVSSGMFILYEMYRRFLQWRQGGGAGSPLRWKNGYRLLGDGGMA
ncbi:hypothetical protein EJ03DRAFT_338494 [Teratosphaeria nubilosa]|uniref:ASST-domain-containing protein n=1 Tax=Teratosphaeria nubilosa TaxID=161662 RepID=A0A6G1L1V3_9PEZI|nr:hypothetical protein EJ03DRAFT_338494 [Teratosphaeria nubilosa]